MVPFSNNAFFRGINAAKISYFETKLPSHKQLIIIITLNTYFCFTNEQIVFKVQSFFTKLFFICAHVYQYIYLYALIFTYRGEHLSTMYTHALWATRARRTHLLETKYFSCRCERCSDPTELGTHLGTLKCPHDNGFILPKDSLDFESEWGCNLCPGLLTASEVLQFTAKLEEDVDEVMIQASKNTLIDLLSR